MTVRISTISALLGAVAFGVPAGAAQFIFAATLSGANETPASSSTGIGSITVIADNVAGTFAITESWSGLSSAVTGAHIHCCAALGSNAPIVIPFTAFPTTTSGTYSNTFTPANFATILSGMQAGLAYANIHTSNLPGGEIRGQLAAVPEPATWAMTILGFGAIGATIRRRGYRAVLRRA